MIRPTKSVGPDRVFKTDFVESSPSCHWVRPFRRLPARDAPASTACLRRPPRLTTPHTDGHFSCCTDDARLSPLESADTSAGSRRPGRRSRWSAVPSPSSPARRACRIEATDIDEPARRDGRRRGAARGQRQRSGGHRLRHPRVPRPRPRRQPAHALPAVDGRPVDPGRHHCGAADRRRTRRTGPDRALRGPPPAPARRTRTATPRPRWLNHAEPEVYAATTRSRGRAPARAGTRRWPACPRHTRPGNGDLDRLERVRRADRPVAAGDQARRRCGGRRTGTARPTAPPPGTAASARPSGRRGGPSTCRLAATPSSANRRTVGVDSLQVRDVVAKRGIGALERRAPRGPRGRRWRARGILEPTASSRRTYRAAPRVHERVAGVGGRVAAVVR